MKPVRSLVLALGALASACGGGGGGSGTTSAPTSGPTATPTPTPAATPLACSLRSRQDWALAQLREWYLFGETLPTSLDPTGYSNVDSYVDALTATARGQGRDRYFTYLTSIAEENAFFRSGSSAGFGFRLSTDAATRRAFVMEAFEDAPALTAGIDRGAEILAIGASGERLRPVSEIIAAEGVDGVTFALGASTPGLTRVLRVTDGAGTREVTLRKADFTLTPVSSRYGARIIEDGGRRVGYLNLRTFISTADPQLRAAFDRFRADGISEFVIDFRYNGGGLVSIASLMGDLLGGDRSPSDVFSFTSFRPEKSNENETRRFEPQPQSVAPARIAFIGTEATASASELVINAFTPYLGTRMALIGSDTFGKPVGQIALDQPSCDDRLRVVAFSVRNAASSDAYYSGLAESVPATCQAGDDVAFPLGDPREASTRQALDFLAGRPCTPIDPNAARARSLRDGSRRLLTPAAPNTSQREVPGLF